MRHREAAERTLLTAVATGASPAALADLLLAADTDRAFADGGHSLDFTNKAFECLDLIGWEHANAALPTVVGQMVAARGAEESTAWRQPIDLIALCTEAAAELPDLFAARPNMHGWSDHAALARALLGDHPVAIMDALKAAIRAGAIASDLGRSLAYAAALRLARFGTANEHADWETAHHVFTYANAIHQMLKRIGMATSRRCMGFYTERWPSTLLAISMCRQPAFPAKAASRSMTCPPMRRRSALLCSMSSIGNDRSISPRVSSRGISHLVTRCSR